MAQSEPGPTQLNMTALRQKQPGAYDLMRPGPGTPWEDRGKRGTIGAFFATCFMSLHSPGRLWNLIRRTESDGDARSFAIGCGILWALGWVISSVTWFYVYSVKDTRFEIDSQWYFEMTAVQFIITPFVVWFMLKLSSSIYYKMASGESANKFSQSLVTNIFAYSLGASLLALIPIAGPTLALFWILFLLMRAGRVRLFLKMSSAIVDGLISLFASVILFAAAYGLVWWLLWVSDYTSFEKRPTLPAGQMPGAARTD